MCAAWSGTWHWRQWVVCAAEMLGLVVGVAVFMGVLALAVHLFCKYNPVVQQAPRIAGAAFEDAALSSARAIASQSFAKLA